METLTSSLAVAALGGLAWAAYNHPSSFGTLATLCRLIALGAVVALLGHEAGALRTQNAGMAAMTALADKFDMKAYDAVRDSMKATELPWWWLGLAGLFLLYVAFLEALPRMGIVKKV